MTVSQTTPPAPGLTRGLVPLVMDPMALAENFTAGPGSSPGRGLVSVNQFAPYAQHGTLCLHPSLSSRRRPLHWAQREFARPHNGTSRWVVRAYSPIQDQASCLVRGTRRLRHLFAARTCTQTLAPKLEDKTDNRRQSELARSNLFDPGLIISPEVGQQRCISACRGSFREKDK